MNTPAPGWPYLFETFERLADLPAAQRARELERIGELDPALRARVERLLALDAGGDDLAAEVAGWRERLLEPESSPTRLGPWRITGELGAGGMGRVFLAERADGAYEQRVALKVVRGEFTSDAALARFLVERRILARLDHPGIAGLIDGGVDAHGRPWFAMRHVDGVPLPQWCATRRAGVRERIRLMLAICDAVSHAHRQLVVHCDLKPSNVLVDGSGQPQLLDFGIARLIGPAADGRALSATQTQWHALTPGYASPQQLAGEPADIATDVYALGAMLYELLCGRRPYAGQDDTAASVVRAQAQGEPVPPSRALLAQSPVAARELRGDLDAIVTTALRHARAERYPDVAALADDLQAWRDGRPLRAQRTSALQRMRKFVTRHRAAVALALLASAGLLATTALALHQGRLARDQAAEASAARDFLVGIFSSADPRSAAGSIDTRALIDRGSAALDSALATQPELAASFAEVLGNVYRGLAAWDDAQAMLQRALALTRARRGAHAPEAAPILRSLAQVLAARNEPAQAARTLAAARAIDEAGHAGAVSGLIEDDAMAADLAQRAGDLARAQTMIDAAIAAAGTNPHYAVASMARLLNQRANIAQARNALDDAEHDTRRALELLQRHSSGQSLDVAENLINLGVLRMRRGDAAGAEDIFRQGLATYRRLLPAEHPLVADAMTDLARALDRQGKGAAAEPIYLDVLAMQRHLFGTEHADVATTLNNLAVLYVGRGDYARARAMMQQVVDIWGHLSGPTHPLALASRGNLGVIEREQGDFAAARATLQAALGDYRKLPDSAMRQAYCLDQLGIVDRYEGRFVQALELHRQAEALRDGVKQLGPIEHAAGLVAFSLGESAAGLGTSALAHANEAVALLEAAKAQGDARYADALLARARAALVLLDLRAAQAALDRAAQLREQRYGSHDWHTAETGLVAAEIEAAKGHAREAVAKAGAARAILLAQRGAGNPLLREADRLLRHQAGGTPH